MKLTSLFVLSLALLSRPVWAQRPMGLGASSMLNQDAGRGLIQRRTALHKGDKLTIFVNESMQGQYAASTTTAKTVSASNDASSIPLVGALSKSALGSVLGGGTSQRLINALLGANSVGGKEASSGSGSTISSGSLTATMSVVVTDVEPNGDLRVEGHRDIRLNKETQHMTLTGIVRADDVSLDNTVASSQIANADIQADGKGAVADKTRRGLISRVLGWIF